MPSGVTDALVDVILPFTGQVRLVVRTQHDGRRNASAAIAAALRRCGEVLRGPL